MGQVFDLRRFSQHQSGFTLQGRIGLCVVVVSAFMAGCSPRLDTEAIATSIHDELLQQGDVPPEKVICPKDLQPEAGQTFTCWGKLSEEEFFPINVEQIDEAGLMDWHIPTSRGVLNLAQLELQFQDELLTEITEEIDQELEPSFQVDCGGTYRVNQPGESFTCQVTDGVIVDARRLELVQVNLDSQGNLNWQGVRNLVPPEELEIAEAEGIAFESIQEEAEDGESAASLSEGSTPGDAADEGAAGSPAVNASFVQSPPPSKAESDD